MPGGTGWSPLPPKLWGLKGTQVMLGHTVGAHMYLPRDGLLLYLKTADSSNPLGPTHLRVAERFFKNKLFEIFFRRSSCWKPALGLQRNSCRISEGQRQRTRCRYLHMDPVGQNCYFTLDPNQILYSRKRSDFPHQRLLG